MNVDLVYVVPVKD